MAREVGVVEGEKGDVVLIFPASRSEFHLAVSSASAFSRKPHVRHARSCSTFADYKAVFFFCFPICGKESDSSRSGAVCQ